MMGPTPPIIPGSITMWRLCQEYMALTVVNLLSFSLLSVSLRWFRTHNLPHNVFVILTQHINILATVSGLLVFLYKIIRWDESTFLLCQFQRWNCFWCPCWWVWDSFHGCQYLCIFPWFPTANISTLHCILNDEGCLRELKKRISWCHLTPKV